MKQKIFYSLIIVLSIVFLNSCENQFEPKTDLINGYVLNCVIRGDTTFQVATISKTYTVEGLNPLENTDDPFIQGAKITLTCSNVYGTEVYTFRDTVIERTDNSRYKTPLHFYYIKNFKPSISAIQLNPAIYVYYSYLMKIEAVLPDGNRLKSYANSVVVDQATVKTYIEDKAQILGHESLELEYGSEKAYPKYVGGVNTLGEMIIYYSKFENGAWNKYQKTVPKYYTTGVNPGIPVYPIMDRQADGVSYDTLTIRKTLEDLSEGDINKQNYIIEKVVFYLHIVESNFERYLMAQQIYYNEFSIRTTQPGFSNITGGGGIFGAMFSLKKEVLLDEMIKSIGYKTD